MIHFPWASITRVAGGSGPIESGVAAATETILPSEITRSESGSGDAPVPSISVAPRNAMVPASRSVPLNALARAVGRRLLRVERVFLLALLFLDLDRVDAG